MLIPSTSWTLLPHLPIIDFIPFRQYHPFNREDIHFSSSYPHSFSLFPCFLLSSNNDCILDSLCRVRSCYIFSLLLLPYAVHLVKNSCSTAYRYIIYYHLPLSLSCASIRLPRPLLPVSLVPVCNPDYVSVFCLFFCTRMAYSYPYHPRTSLVSVCWLFLYPLTLIRQFWSLFARLVDNFCLSFGINDIHVVFVFFSSMCDSPISSDSNLG